jgi:uncharacterized protein (TIGR02186 family)
MMRLLLPALLFLAGATSAQAERLVVSLSNHGVQITSNFVGENLVLFGTVEPEPGKTLRPGGYDLVVTVNGPRQTFRARRKSRVLGIWVNTDSRKFVQVPSYLAILADRPFADITDAETRRRLQIGLDNFLLTQRIGADFADTVHDDPFRVAFVRLQRQQHLYYELPNGVTFLTPAVFRAAIPLPANAPTGNYRVDVKLFADGKQLVQTDTALEVIKAGFEQYVAEAAVSNGLLYGLATALMALCAGWLASVVFRRD